MCRCRCFMFSDEMNLTPQHLLGNISINPKRFSPTWIQLLSYKFKTIRICKLTQYFIICFLTYTPDIIGQKRIQCHPCSMPPYHPNFIIQEHHHPNLQEQRFHDQNTLGKYTQKPKICTTQNLMNDWRIHSTFHWYKSKSSNNFNWWKWMN